MTLLIEDICGMYSIERVKKLLATYLKVAVIQVLVKRKSFKDIQIHIFEDLICLFFTFDCGWMLGKTPYILHDNLNKQLL